MVIFSYEVVIFKSKISYLRKLFTKKKNYLNEQQNDDLKIILVATYVGFKAFLIL